MAAAEAAAELRLAAVGGVWHRWGVAAAAILQAAVVAARPAAAVAPAALPRSTAGSIGHIWAASVRAMATMGICYVLLTQRNRRRRRKDQRRPTDNTGCTEQHSRKIQECQPCQPCRPC